MKSQQVKTISVITPCFNASRYILETVHSVLNQTAVVSKQVNLEYFVIDGGSTDGTPELVRSLNHPQVRVVSETDRGMYDALAKGLASITGDVTAYINAGDYYHPAAFDIVSEVMTMLPVEWVTGASFWYNERSQITDFQLPRPYRRRFIRRGLYGRGLLQFIQQESTFWRSHLNDLLNLNALSQLRLAGDYYLWSRFSSVTDLHIVNSHLAGFRIHEGQLSSSFSAYVEEVDRVCEGAANFSDYLRVWSERFLNRFPDSSLINRGRLPVIRWRQDAQVWA